MNSVPRRQTISWEKKICHYQGDNFKCVKWIHFLMERNKREKEENHGIQGYHRKIRIYFLLFMLVGAVRFSEKIELLLTKIK